MPVSRVTLFKVSSKDDISRILEEYDKIPSAVKDGKRYIVSCKASETIDDKRSQGYNFAARTTFETLEDMKFYDTDCAAHQALKAVVIPLVDGAMTVYWEE